MKTMQKALLSLISGLFLISPAVSQEYKQVSLVDLGVNTRRFAGKPIEIKNVWCYFSDVDDYRCAGSGATAVFFKKIENEEAKTYLEDKCDTVAKATSSACRFTLRFTFREDNVRHDFISGMQERTLIKPDIGTIITPAPQQNRQRR